MSKSKDSAKARRAEKKIPAPKKELATPSPSAVTSVATPVAPATPAITATTPVTIPAGEKKMDLTLNHKPNSRKTDRLVIFDLTDRKGSVQFLRTLFPDAIPQSIVISGEFSAPRTPRAKETPEERKARLKALPKLTPAEKLAKAEERVAKMRAKIQAKEAAAASAQASA